MLSEIIKNIALILDDQQVLEYLDYNQTFTQNNSEETIKQPKNIDMYIALTNFVLTDIAQNFLCYKCTQDLLSDTDGKIKLADFLHVPCSIKCIKNDEGKKVRFYITDDDLVVDEAGKLYFVEYAFLPDALSSLDDSVLLPIGLDIKTLVYGVVSEYLATKMQYTEANIWEQKFKQGLKNMLRRYRDLRVAYRSLI